MIVDSTFSSIPTFYLKLNFLHRKRFGIPFGSLEASPDFLVSIRTSSTVGWVSAVMAMRLCAHLMRDASLKQNERITRINEKNSLISNLWSLIVNPSLPSYLCRHPVFPSLQTHPQLPSLISTSKNEGHLQSWLLNRLVVVLGDVCETRDDPTCLDCVCRFL